MARALFLGLNWNKTNGEATFFECIQSFLYGAKLDASVTGYLIFFPTLILIADSIFKHSWFLKTVNIYTNILILIISILVMIDSGVYPHWGNKLDVYGAFYLNNIGEVMNFVSFKTVILSILLFLILGLPFYFIYKKGVHPILYQHKSKWTSAFVFLLLGIMSILPIRGGLSINPINLSTVYFSNKTFFNHSAINVAWNIIYTYSEKDKLYQSFEYFDTNKVQSYVKQLYPLNLHSPKLLTAKRPNIVFVILESFTSKLIFQKWDNITITPNLNDLAKEGFYFSNFYSSGDRTDEGLVSILSGYPAQPISYIINYQSKTAKLPSIVRDLKKVGYHTSFYYGGDINFANMKSFLLQSGMEEIIEKNDFPQNKATAKWGLHDEVVFEKVLDDIKKSETPFFKTILTLTSHPPFETPVPVVINGPDVNTLFANSANYTDRALGNFINELKQDPVWKNTLVVLVADHGVPYLDNCSVSDPKKFKIPMIWLGGALGEQLTLIDKYASQTDIANTLLSQLDMPAENYPYSKNIFSPASKSFSFYTWNHGFGFLGDSTTHIYNHTSRRFKIKEGKEFPDSIGNAYLQMVSDDYLKK